MFTKTIDVISLALEYNIVLPLCIFDIKDLFINKITDVELTHVLAHVNALILGNKDRTKDKEKYNTMIAQNVF